MALLQWTERNILMKLQLHHDRMPTGWKNSDDRKHRSRVRIQLELGIGSPPLYGTVVQEMGTGCLDLKLGFKAVSIRVVNRPGFLIHSPPPFPSTLKICIQLLATTSSRLPYPNPNTSKALVVWSLGLHKDSLFWRMDSKFAVSYCVLPISWNFFIHATGQLTAPASGWFNQLVKCL